MVKQTIEHRNDLYTFKSKKDLISFFSQYLSRDSIYEIYKKEKKSFKKREGSSKYLTKLQLLKKVEYALSRFLKEK